MKMTPEQIRKTIWALDFGCTGDGLHGPGSASNFDCDWCEQMKGEITVLVMEACSAEAQKVAASVRLEEAKLWMSKCLPNFPPQPPKWGPERLAALQAAAKEKI